MRLSPHAKLGLVSDERRPIFNSPAALCRNILPFEATSDEANPSSL